MKHFIKSGALHAFDDDYTGPLITEDMTPASPEQVAALRVRPAAELRALYLKQLIPLRKTVFDILGGMQSEALTLAFMNINATENGEKALAITEVQALLKDMTAHDTSACTTDAQFKAFWKQAWLDIVVTTPESIRSAFRDVVND